MCDERLCTNVTGVCRYISELSPSPFRGRLVTVSSLFITGGQVVAYIIGWLFSSMPHGWKWMVGLGALPAVLQFLTLGSMPETPRWLVKANRKESARRVLRKVYAADAADVRMDKLVEALLRRVEKEVLEEEEAANSRRHHHHSTIGSAPKSGMAAKVAAINDGFSELVNVGAHRRALVIACMLQGYQQLCGFNSLMYFSATIFALVGFRNPTLTSLSIALTNFAFTLVAFHSIDRIGRRRILLLSVPVMVVGLALCSVAFNFLDLPDQEESAPSVAAMVVRRAAEEAGGSSSVWAMMILLAMIVYVASYAVGMGNVPWQQSEYVFSPTSHPLPPLPPIHKHTPLPSTTSPLFPEPKRRKKTHERRRLIVVADSSPSPSARSAPPRPRPPTGAATSSSA